MDGAINQLVDAGGFNHDLLRDLEEGTFLHAGPQELVTAEGIEAGLRAESLFKHELGEDTPVVIDAEAELDDNGDIVYNPNPTAKIFHEDKTSRVKALKSGVGMGKTSALAIELMLKAQEQAPDKHGVRYTKWAVIRSTYAQLKTTTLRTFLEWMPQDYVKVVYGSPITATLQMQLEDGTTVYSEFLFFPLDRPAQYANLLSLEITGCAINEVSEIRLASVLKYLLSRCGRYPPKRVAEATWKGAIMDYNPPPIGSWVHVLFEKKRPNGYARYSYPPAVLITKDENDPEDESLWQFEMNPEAENTQHVVSNYWLDLCEDYRYDWAMLQRFVLGEYTYGGVGRPVFKSFSERRHVRRGLIPWRGTDLCFGFDFGLYTAVTIGQMQDGKLTILNSFSVPDSGLVMFLEDYLLPLVHKKFNGMVKVATGDPSGEQRDAVYKQKAIRVLKQYGFRFVPSPTNAISHRLDAVNHFLRAHDKFQIDPTGCEELVNALAGAYHWKQNTTNEIVQEKPDKDDASHIADSLQYLCQMFAPKAGGMARLHGQSERPQWLLPNSTKRVVTMKRAGASTRFS